MRMGSPVAWLRAASVLTFIHAVLHTVGGVFGKPEPGTPAMVATVMQNNHFQAFGVTRSYGDFYLGMGLGVTIFLAVAAVLFWQLSNIARQNPALIRPILMLLAVGFLAFAAVSYRYFFAAPVIVEILIAVCTMFAFFASDRVTPR